MPPTALDSTGGLHTFIAVLNLTTTFTPPSSCLAPTYTLAPLGNDIAISNAANDTYVVTRGFQPACYPADFLSLGGKEVVDSLNTTLTAAYYSPGVCPAGYITNTITVEEGATTFATCCPSYVLILHTPAPYAVRKADAEAD